MTYPTQDNAVTLVQNGTEIMSKKLCDYIDRYRSFAKQTAQSFIGLAKTLAEAKSTLNPVEFNSFCQNINLDSKGSTFKKILKIGQESVRFEPVLEMLPNSWTTIYELAKLDSEKFTNIYEMNILNPLMTAAELKAAINGSTKEQEKVKNLDPDFTLKLYNLTTEQKSQIYKFMYDLKNEYAFDLDVRESLTKEIIDFTTRLAA